MTEISEIQVAIARLESRVCNIDKRGQKMADNLKTNSKALQEIRLTLSEVKGSWRALVMLGSASAAVGAAVSQFWPLR